jgi:hypothetical protein
MLPLVTDVVRELAKTVSADPAVLFKAARSVVAEELAKVKQGFEAAPLGVLVKRARLQLERDGAGMPVPESAPPMPVYPARPAPAREAPGLPLPSPKPTAVDDPFQDLATRSDLNWERDLPIQPEDAPFRSAILPIPHKSRGPLGISAPSEAVRDRGPAPAPLTYAPEPSSAPPPLPLLPPVTAAPRAGAPPPLTYAPESKIVERKSPERDEPPLSRETRPGLTGDRFDELPNEALKPLPRPAVASAPSIPLVHPHEPAASSMPEMPASGEPLEDADAQPVVEEFHFKTADHLPPPPRRSGGRGWLVAIALVLAVAAVLAWAVREYVFRNETVKNVAPIARNRPEEAPVAIPTPLPVPTPAPIAAAKPAAPAAKAPSAAPVPKGRAALLLTPDWAGKSAVYVIHFSSTKDRESAAKEALKLGAALGAPARAVQVDLGDKGVWYRVVVGEFPDVDAARAFRAELEAKKTPGMGFVYEMRGR